ncbi:MAG: hypothetical protein Q4C01_05895 [Clostridia bacterium]|nr:hypothetical protein [Clostridia bacterium]
MKRITSSILCLLFCFLLSAPVLRSLASETLKIDYVYTRGGVVNCELAQGFTAQYCCFSSVNTCPELDSPDWTRVSGRCFSVFKSDGDYYLFVRDAEDRVSEPFPVSVDSDFNYVIKAEGLRALSEPLEDFLNKNGSGTEQLNAAIAADTVAAGLYTRCGVVTAAVSLVSHMAEYGASVVYQGRGSYQDDEDWGVNPRWGARLGTPTSDGNGTYYYEGMQCVASIVWAYKQAGINLYNREAGSQIGCLGEWEKSGDNRIAYDAAQSGDIVQQGGHFLMVVDRLDTDGDGAHDSYLTYEMEAPHLSFLILTFRQVRYRTFFDMSAVFENAGRHRDKAYFWNDSFFIPAEAFPEHLMLAYEKSAEDRAFYRLLSGLGLVRKEGSGGV